MNRPARRARVRTLSASPGAIRSRRWRARQDKRKAVALVEFDHEVVDMADVVRLDGQHPGKRLVEQVNVALAEMGCAAA